MNAWSINFMSRVLAGVYFAGALLVFGSVRPTHDVFYTEPVPDPYDIPYPVAFSGHMQMIVDQVDQALSAQDWETAARLLEDMVLADAGSAIVYLTLIRVYQELGQTSHAIALAAEMDRHLGTLQQEIALPEVEGDTRWWKMREQIQAAGPMGGLRLRHDLALVYLQSAATTGQVNDYYQAAMFYASAGERDRAIAILRDVIRQNPTLAEPRQRLAMIYTGLGDFRAAIQELQSARTAEPQDMRTLLDLASLHVQLNESDQAVAYLTEALRVEPGIENAHFYLGLRADQMGVPAQAVHHYEQEIQLNPNHGGALNNLAWILATMEEFKDPPRAVELARRACELVNYQRFYEVDTLLMALVANGETGEALRVLELAMPLAEAEKRTDTVNQYLQLREQLQQP